jgi:hypothetical protein
MKALIDGDIVLHRCAGSCEPTKIKPFVEPPDTAIQRMTDLVRRILTETAADEFTIYVGDGKTFRHILYPEYKAHRIKPRPTHYELLKNILFKDYPTTLVTEIETDDRLGIEQVKMGDSSIICSIDKDLLQIPGHHYNFVRQYRSFVSPSDGLRTFYRQLVTGDGTDNIPGYDGKIRHSVPQFLEKLMVPLDEMEDEWDMYKYCLDIYNDSVYDDNFPMHNPNLFLHRNAQLLYILKEEGVYWQPPKKNENQVTMIGVVQDIIPSSSECYDKALEDIHQNTNV